MPYASNACTVILFLRVLHWRLIAYFIDVISSLLTIVWFLRDWMSLYSMYVFLSDFHLIYRLYHIIRHHHPVAQ